MTLEDMAVQIAPGVKYNTWSFSGHGAPGRSSTCAKARRSSMTLTNGGRSRIRSTSTPRGSRPDRAFRDVAPGKSFTFSFKAGDPGVYM